MWVQEPRGWGRLSLTLLTSPTDLFFSMAGLTSSVASALSELSLSDVDLASSVHSDVASRRLSAQAHPAGELEHPGGTPGTGRTGRGLSAVGCQESPSDAWISTICDLVPWGPNEVVAGDIVHRAQVFQ